MNVVRSIFWGFDETSGHDANCQQRDSNDREVQVASKTCGLHTYKHDAMGSYQQSYKIKEDPEVQKGMQLRQPYDCTLTRVKQKTQSATPEPCLTKTLKFVFKASILFLVLIRSIGIEYIYTHTYVYVCMCVYIYIHTYIHIYIHTHKVQKKAGEYEKVYFLLIYHHASNLQLSIAYSK